VARAVGSRSFTFSLLVHSDAASPMVDWSQSSSILQVRAAARGSARSCVFAHKACASACVVRQRVRVRVRVRWLVQAMLFGCGVRARARVWCAHLLAADARARSCGRAPRARARALCCALPQVRSDCPPRQLVEFLLSDSGVLADQVRARRACACVRAHAWMPCARSLPRLLACDRCTL
jgi:hypothetical protein